MSVRSDKALITAQQMDAVNQMASLEVAAQATDAPLGEGNGFSTVNSDAPLKRNLVVSIKASLNDFCLQKNKATWAPSQEALRSIFQQRRLCALLLHHAQPCAHNTHALQRQCCVVAARRSTARPSPWEVTSRASITYL